MVQFWRAGHILAIGTNMAACSSFCCLFLSIVTDSWLCTKERAIVSNGSFAYVTIYSGLWRRCTLDPRALHPTTFNCSYIGYFTHVERDGIGPTDSILLSLRKATGFPMVGLVLMLIAQTVCFVSHCSLHRQCLTITFGVMFVSGGLLTLVGIIIYIGAITEEAGNKLKSKDDFPFQYFYGPSLVMAICSFVASQMTGVIAVNLFLSRKRQKVKCANQATSNALTVAVVTDGKKSSTSESRDAVNVDKFVISDHKTFLRDGVDVDNDAYDDSDDVGARDSKQQQLRQQHWMDDYFNHHHHQQQHHHHYYHQDHHHHNHNHQQQQQHHHRLHHHHHHQQQRPHLTTSNSVDYYQQYNPQPRKEFSRQESFDMGRSLPRLQSRPSERLRRLVRNYSEETYSWRLHGSDSNSLDKSVDNIYLSVHKLHNNHRHLPPKSSSHGRLTQILPRQLSNASRSPDHSVRYDSSAILHRRYNSSNRLHQANQVSRSRLRINNAVADWPTSTLASANQRKVIASSHALGAGARRDRTTGSRKIEMIRQWSEMAPEQDRIFSQSKERLRLSHEELNYSHRRITPV